MPFANRNAYYLRISPYSVLPLFLYLDERHTSWMSDATLQLVLEDLRHRIGPKLRAESAMIMGNTAGKQKPAVDVHRGTSYQFAYFLRKADPHTVLVKQRTFVLRPPEPKLPKVESPSDEVPPNQPAGRKRARGNGKTVKKPASKSSPAKRGKKRKAREESELEEEEPHVESEEHDEGNPAPASSSNAQPRRSGRTRTVISGGYADEDDEEDQNMEDSAIPPAPTQNSEPPEPEPLFRPPTPPDDGVRPVKSESVENGDDTISVPPAASSAVIDFSMDPDEEEEEKPKPQVELSYTGFSIFGCSLCVIVEPYPPMRAPSVVPASRPRQASLAPLWGSSRSLSVQPEEDDPSGTRGKTPLFLRETPFDDERYSRTEREPTPLFRLETPEPEMRGASVAPSMQRGVSPAFSVDSELDDAEDFDGDSSMLMEFSQVLSSAGTGRLGGRDDGDEEGGEGFFGDADEGRDNV